MSRNQDLHVLHVDDADAFAASVDHRVVTGDTLVFDYVFFLHPARGGLAACLSACACVCDCVSLAFDCVFGLRPARGGLAASPRGGQRRRAPNNNTHTT